MVLLLDTKITSFICIRDAAICFKHSEWAFVNEHLEARNVLGDDLGKKALSGSKLLIFKTSPILH